MHPVLLHIGEIEIHSYGVAGALGFLVGCFIVLRRSAQLGLVKERVADVIFWASIAALVGARALFVWQFPEEFDGWRDWVNIRSGGLVFYGAMVVGLPVAAAVMWRYSLPFFKLMDVFATALPLSHAISRVGCFFAGCCYGVPTDRPWGVTFTNELAAAPKGIPLHPTQLYEVGYLVAIFAVTTWFYGRKRFDGQVMLLYLGLYPLFRSANELLRGDERGWFLEPVLGQTLSSAQAISIGVALAAFTVFLAVPLLRRKTPEPTPTA